MTALSHSSPAGSVDEWAGTPVGYRRTAVTVTNDTLADQASALASQGYRLALVAAHDDGDALRAVYLYTAAAPDRRVELHLPIDLADPVVPSLAALSFPAGRFEREMHDLYGIIPRDHPLPRRLVRHDHWPRGWYPMRRDAGPPPEFGEEQPFPFLTVEGPGVYEIPVGPIHAGLIEPGHFRFSVVGETILKLKARLWYVHRGVERLFAGREVADGIPLAERVSGDTAVGHTLAYCRAVEDALGLEVPSEARRARALLLELERLYNHVGDLGALCNDVGHGILHTHALRIRERLLRLNADVTGHRLLRGGVRIGGSSLRQVPDADQVAAIAADIAELVDLALTNSLVAERFAGTAVLAAAQARDLGTLGYVARASGLDLDARRDHPTGVLAEVTDSEADVLTVPVHTSGDVMARFQQRAAEIEASAALLALLIPTVEARTVTAPATSAPAEATSSPRSGVGIAEGWRGTIVHRVELADDGTLTRNKIVDPSFFNWPALPISLTSDTIVPDFPLANKSFNLSYAGNDL
ncbi:MAG TPA: NADH-quinone oxidoreductase subunit C [Natronosporangium sp.]|nr:NADH-quinone oxidoreductase subunit C [Natronosporangium sp.]